MELRDRQATYKGFGDALALGVEMVFTPLLFALVGWWLDGRLGTGPLFAILFGLFGARRRLRARLLRVPRRMAKEEEGKPWVRQQRQP